MVSRFWVELVLVSGLIFPLVVTSARFSIRLLLAALPSMMRIFSSGLISRPSASLASSRWVWVALLNRPEFCS